MTLLEAKSISKVYQTGKIRSSALTDVSLKVSAKEFISIIGPSGSGKTTLLNLLGCLDLPSKGEVFVLGHSLTGKSANFLADLRRDYFGYVFQFFNLIPVLTAVENVAYPLWQTRLSLDKASSLALRALDLVGLKGLAQNRPDELSGGQQQRVAAARAIVNNPKIVFADEPTGNLDSVTAQQLIDLLKEINQNCGTTFVIASHDPKIIQQTERVIEIKDGRII